jgi:hypothetical protein
VVDGNDGVAVYDDAKYDGGNYVSALCSKPGDGGWLALRDDEGNTNAIIRGYQYGTCQAYFKLGRVGIGTSSPTAGLNIKGADDPETFIHLDTSADVDAGIKFRRKGTTKWNIHNKYMSSDDALRLAPKGASSSGGITIGQNGHVGIMRGTAPGNYYLYVMGNAYASGSWGGSDLRWKKNITPLENSLQKVCQLQGINYEWRINEFPDQGFFEGPQIGLIAQDVEGVIPELVSTDTDGYKALAYDKLTAVLVEAIKEIKAENDQLKSRLNEVEAKLAK